MTEEQEQNKLLIEEPIKDEEVNSMTSDDMNARLIAYRSHINEGGTLSKNAHSNALRILRQLRHRAVAANPHAKKGARKKAEVATALDLSQFGG